MLNPIQRVREVRRLSRRDFALLLGLSYDVLYRHEVGLVATVNPGVRRGLDSLGEDVDQVATEFEEWRHSRRREILKRGN